MKHFLTILLTFFFFQASFASHLKGGWIQYAYLGPGSDPTTSRYQITVRQYLSCASTSAQRDANVYLGVFDGLTNQLLTTITIPLAGSDNPNKTTYSACISSPPPVCYFIDRYTATVDLPNNIVGYTLAVQRCCRISGIVNVSGNSSAIGISYTNKIPGTINGVDYSHNSSPVFAQKDTVIVCYNSHFTFDFSATDPDNDSLSYSFCAGLVGGNSSSAGAQPDPPSNPPYAAVSYSAAFDGSLPMGSGVIINEQTGIISGTAPSITGDYVVAVCANEYRNGVLIGITKKEIHITVAACSISAAELKPNYSTCNGTTLTFQNESPSASITSYFWDFGVPNLTNDTSTQPIATFDYLKSGKDTGTYIVKLVVVSSASCSDSATAVVKIYPGFKPGFQITGNCYINSYQFLDTSTTVYGSVNSWSWNFGDSTSSKDTSSSKNSSWKYPNPTKVLVTLIVANDKGCIDTVTKPFIVPDKPAILLGFKDTLICSNDSLTLKAFVSAGSVIWTPNNIPNQNRILNSSTLTPIVFPQDTTQYFISVNDNGCANTDTVTVNVLKFISVYAGADTAICRTDSFRLQPLSYALNYLWTASTGEVIQNIKNPFVRPLANTQYYVIANLGKCQARDSLSVVVTPYPVATLGADTTICFGSRLQLKGRIIGSSFSWNPSSSLSDPNSLTPVAGPSKTTAYILTATDTLGCPKPAYDTLVVTVIPPINAYAGKDTLILPEQSLQLNASGGDSYFWTPSTGLSNNSIANPVVTLGASVDSIIYNVRVSVGVCYADDKVTVSVYKKGPDILVPSAFTPNGDGKNDVIKPITIGIVRLNYFTIFNRYGEPIFATAEIGKGWDGIYKNIPQASGTYVYEVQGVDTGGQLVFRKGTIVLIR